VWIGLFGLGYVSLWTFWFRKKKAINYLISLATISLSRRSLAGSISLRLQGGLKAVVWTDTLQQIIMMGSSIIVVGLGIIAVGGLDVTWQRSLDGDRIEFFKYVKPLSDSISN
jgi:Na+/proline symporter